MKAYEVIGYAYEGALYHDGCQPEGAPEEELAPVFACTELDPLDSCDKCVSEWITKNPGKKVDSLHVYLDEYAAGEALSERE